ncbi:hypothetical protein V8C43DRAFT_122175 [Trichoderma afarasin]
MCAARHVVLLLYSTYTLSLKVAGGREVVGAERTLALVLLAGRAFRHTACQQHTRTNSQLAVAILLHPADGGSRRTLSGYLPCYLP